MSCPSRSRSCICVLLGCAMFHVTSERRSCMSIGRRGLRTFFPTLGFMLPGFTLPVFLGCSVRSRVLFASGCPDLSPVFTLLARSSASPRTLFVSCFTRLCALVVVASFPPSPRSSFSAIAFAITSTGASSFSVGTTQNADFW